MNRVGSVQREFMRGLAALIHSARRSSLGRRARSLALIDNRTRSTRPCKRASVTICGAGASTMFLAIRRRRPLIWSRRATTLLSRNGRGIFDPTISQGEDTEADKNRNRQHSTEPRTPRDRRPRLSVPLLARLCSRSLGLHVLAELVAIKA